MDEYFCPNCGAVLNNQYGFDPDGGTWRCTECGEVLMDDDVYNGDSFEGIAWYCDSCGVLLNRQYGFSDICEYWTCTNCGHSNRISEDDIVSEEQIEFFCPSCRVALDFQPGFNRYDDDWECTSCGSHLHHNYSSDKYSVVEEPKHKCSSCGADLDNQWCYVDYQNEWTCAECGAHLYHSYSDEEYIVIKYICPRCDAPLDIQYGFDEDNENWQCEECGTHLHHDYYDDEYVERDEEDFTDSSDSFEQTDSDKQYYSYSSASEHSERVGNNGSSDYNTKKSEDDTLKKKTKKKTKKKINWKLRLGGILFFIIVALIGIGCYEINLLTSVGYSSAELMGKNYEKVVSFFEKAGFNYILTSEIADLSLQDIADENKVTMVKIGFFENFESTSKYPSNFPVVITYHSLERYSVPMSSKEAKGTNYQDVIKKFKEAGFENVTLEVEYDIITGWITDDGEVKSVTVNEEGKFISGKEYRADAEVVITYHTYRKNKPK